MPVRGRLAGVLDPMVTVAGCFPAYAIIPRWSLFKKTTKKLVCKPIDAVTLSLIVLCHTNNLGTEVLASPQLNT